MSTNRNEELLSWVEEAVTALPDFLSSFADEKIPGRYKYSLSGDIVTKAKWGLGNTVFAAKNYFTLGVLDRVNVRDMCNYIQSFQTKNGQIYDPLVQRKAFLRRVRIVILLRKWIRPSNEEIRRAETRQAFAALSMLGGKPERPYYPIPYDAEGIHGYVHALNWSAPWGAGSHFSHLIFFLRTNAALFGAHANDSEELIDYAFKEANTYKQKEGAWYRSDVSIPDYQKINGAMKMMTAYEAADRDDFDNPDGLIDLCLSVANDKNACDNFNIVCVLYHCAKKSDHRKDEIRQFCLDRLKTYRRHYWPEYGGFSFYEKRANDVYYLAKITKGLEEPDIHGTHLFLWGIALITKMMGMDERFGLKIPIT
jgi:hypothetical protein